MKQDTYRSSRRRRPDGRHPGDGHPRCDPPKTPEELDFHFPFPPRLPRPRPPVYTPFLLLRSNAGDQGIRPIDWMEFLEDNGSPDIRVVGPLGIPNLVPTPGQPHQISALVRNLGRQGSAAEVRFWAYQSLLGGEAVSELIGRATAFVPARGSSRVQCPTSWIPGDGDLLSVMVDVSDPVADPIAVPFDPLLDRHVAQQIIMIESQPPGGDFDFRFAGGNLTLSPQPVIFELRLLGGSAGTGIPLEMQVSGASRYIGAPTLTYARRLLSVTDFLARRGWEGQRPVAAITRTITFEPGEVCEVHVRGQLPTSARPGQRFAVAVSQRIGPIVTGNAVLNVEVK
jgi:hypothetical protein